MTGYRRAWRWLLEELRISREDLIEGAMILLRIVAVFGGVMLVGALASAGYHRWVGPTPRWLDRYHSVISWTLLALPALYVTAVLAEEWLRLRRIRLDGRQPTEPSPSDGH